jgi:hypothetical protein
MANDEHERPGSPGKAGSKAQRLTQWPKGTSGNPKGYRRGSKHKATLFAESLLSGENEDHRQATLGRQALFRLGQGLSAETGPWDHYYCTAFTSVKWKRNSGSVMEPSCLKLISRTQSVSLGRNDPENKIC